MIKNILAIATVVALSACSSSSDPAPESGTPPVNPPTPPVDGPAGGGNPPSSDTKAGAYIGDFGSGQGVYVINNDNILMGLALDADGSANSLFGDVGAGSAFSGDLRGHFHDASNPSDQGIFGAGRVADPATTAFNLNIVNGQTIESLSGPSVALTGVSAGDLTPATAASLAGDWSGRHRFCGADIVNCDFLVTEITFTGTDISGRTVVLDEATSEEVFPNAIAGGLTDFGDAALVSFVWNNNTYNGVAFFIPGTNDQLAFVGETLGESDNKTIASLLTR